MKPINDIHKLAILEAKQAGYGWFRTTAFVAGYCKGFIFCIDYIRKRAEKNKVDISKL